MATGEKKKVAISVDIDVVYWSQRIFYMKQLYKMSLTGREYDYLL